MLPLVQNNIIKIKDLCKKQQVESFYLFGSAANGTFKNGSDLDFLARFSNTIKLIDYADNYFDLLEMLKSIFKTEVDLVS